MAQSPLHHAGEMQAMKSLCDMSMYIFNCNKTVEAIILNCL